MIGTAASQLIDGFEQTLTMFVLKSVFIKERVFLRVVESFSGHRGTW